MSNRSSKALARKGRRVALSADFGTGVVRFAADNPTMTVVFVAGLATGICIGMGVGGNHATT